ncbi:MAG TPA: alpha/beta hydrolase [Burkholderiales bacterium]|nr:alpha/beta hydrolase [Burkholderiales bacterium]
MIQDATGTPALDPQARVLLERFAASPAPALDSLSAAEARRSYREGRLALAPPPLAIEETRDFFFPGAGGEVRARYYRPLGEKPGEALPAAVYFHGGGWTCGDLDTHDSVCRGIAVHGRCAVVAVDYRMGPEHRFPAAVEDAIAAVKWVSANAISLGIDASRLAVAGESAGGNLAAVAAIALRETGPAIAMQVLVYPVVDQASDTDSLRRFARGYSLTLELLRWYQKQYLGDEGDRADWRASPLLARDHSRLPSAYIVTAGFDPLLDEGKAYADRLKQAGVPVVYECFEGMIHGFLPMGGALAAAHHAHYRIGQMLRTRFGTFPGIRP